jgi:lipid-binding SYLF domain-containing protein
MVCSLDGIYRKYTSLHPLDSREGSKDTTQGLQAWYLHRSGDEDAKEENASSADEYLPRLGDFMKKVAICFVLVMTTATVFAAMSKEEVRRLNESAAVLSELRHAPDKGIPEDIWNKAQCVLVIPSLKKAAFVFGGEYGSGVMSCRTSAWSAPVFMQLTKGSWGAQIGAEEIDLVLLVMNRRGVDKLLQDKVSLGADASLAAGPVGRSTAAATDAQMHAEMLSYSRSQGLFAGIDLSGGVLRPDKEADARAYGPNVTARAIIEGAGQIDMPASARSFVTSLGRDVRATSGQR